MKKKNLTSKKKNFLPKSLEGKKALCKYLRILEFRIIRKLEKDNELRLSTISS